MEEQILPGGKSLDWVFKQIAEHNDERATAAANDLIKTAGDREMRTEFTKLVTKYQKCKDSIEMHTAMEDVIQYAKSQYGLILVQGFRMGQGYQQKIANDAFKEILSDAAKKADDASKEQSEDESGTKS